MLTPGEVTLARETFMRGVQWARNCVPSSQRHWLPEIWEAEEAAKSAYPSVSVEQHRTFEWEDDNGNEYVYRYDRVTSSVQYTEKGSKRVGWAVITQIPAEIAPQIADLMAKPYETVELP